MKHRLVENDTAVFDFTIRGFGVVMVIATYQEPEPQFDGGWFIKEVRLNGRSWSADDTARRWGVKVVESMEKKAAIVGRAQAEPDPDRKRD